MTDAERLAHIRDYLQPWPKEHDLRWLLAQLDAVQDERDQMIDALRLSYDDNMCWRKKCEELQSRLALVEQANRDANALIGADADARAAAEKALREQLAAAEERLTELRYADTLDRLQVGAVQMSQASNTADMLQQGTTVEMCHQTCTHRHVEYFPDEWTDRWRCTDCGGAFGPVQQLRNELLATADAALAQIAQVEQERDAVRERCESLATQLRDANALICADAVARTESETGLRIAWVKEQLRMATCR